jgi:hypothetical protein
MADGVALLPKPELEAPGEQMQQRATTLLA